MKFVIVLAVLIAAVASDINPSNCGRRPALVTSIVGGVESKNGGHPWIVSMEYGNGITFSHSCGGSLLNNRWVLTAAHCVSGRPNTANYRIQIGAHNRGSQNGWQYSRSIDRVIYHPSYSSSTYKNDIALLRLSTPAVFDDHYILPACLYDGKEQIASDTKAVAAGWGTTSSGGVGAQILRQVELSITTNASCNSYYGSSYDAITMICLGDVGDNKDTCQGDSGGPNVVQLSDGKWYEIGVTSWGYGCGDIGVYARVSTYIQWIKDIMAANP